jgi:outer membrane protein assembly factor BamD (BamD/ComL family)
LTPPAPAPTGTTPAAAGAAAAAPAAIPPTAVDVTPEAAATAAPAEPRMSARQLYTTARDQYNKGDWVNARKNFVAAVDAGYKSRMFEDSPQTYLRRMDKKEQRDEALAAKQSPPPAAAAGRA